MGKLDDLHALVHSFSKAEKRSFRRNAGAYTGSQLLDLFDLLNRQTHFSVGEMNAELKKAGLARNLPTLMRRLRRQLINSQRNLYSHHSTESRLQYLLEEVQYLYRRNLPYQALTAIKKAKKLALNFSRITLALQFNFYHRQILLDLEQRGRPYDEIREEETRLLKLTGLQMRLEDLQVQARALARGGKTDGQKPREFLTDPDLDAGINSADFLCQLYARYTRGVLHYALREYENARSEFREVMDLWEKNPEWINEKPRLFLGSSSNFQTCLMLTQREGFKEMENFHDLFSAHRFQEPDVRLQFERGSYQTRLLLLLNQARFQDAAVLAEEINSWLSEREQQLPLSPVLALRYNLFAFYFVQERFSEANRVARDILQMSGSEERKDIRELMRVAELLLQFELGNDDLVDNLSRSLSRYFMKRSKLPPQFPVLLDFFRKGAFYLERREAFSELLEELQRVTAESEGSYLGQQELLLWAESRATAHPMPDLFRDLLKA